MVIIVIYHGSENIIEKPEYKGSREGTDFGVTGKDIVKNISQKNFMWLIDNGAILHTQDTKYVFHEMKRVRKIELK